MLLLPLPLRLQAWRITPKGLHPFDFFLICLQQLHPLCIAYCPGCSDVTHVRVFMATRGMYMRQREQRTSSNCCVRMRTHSNRPFAFSAEVLLYVLSSSLSRRALWQILRKFENSSPVSRALFVSMDHSRSARLAFSRHLCSSRSDCASRRSELAFELQYTTIFNLSPSWNAPFLLP